MKNRKPLALLLWVFFVDVPALCQEQPETKRAAAYLTAGPGVGVFDEASAAILAVGGGFEGIVGGGIGALVDVAGVFTRAYPQKFGSVSVGPVVQFRRSSRVVPFLTGGYTGNFGSSVEETNLLHVGGGFTAWQKRWGVRFEGRFHTRDDAAFWSYVSFRVGVQIR